MKTTCTEANLSCNCQLEYLATSESENLRCGSGKDLAWSCPREQGQSKREKRRKRKDNAQALDRVMNVI